MKKLIAIISMLFLLPLSAFGLTMMDDSQMNDVTAQAGVSIGIDVHLDLSVDTAAWGDDGVDTDGDGVVDTAEGWIGASDTTVTNMFVGLREDYNNAANFANSELLTIDVGTDASLYNGSTFVRIGLGTLGVYADTISMDIELGDGDLTDGDLLGQQMGSVVMTGFEMLFGEGGYVDITTDGRTGVTLGLNVILDEINMDLMTWGDADGIAHVLEGTAAAAATVDGYVGLATLDIDSVVITGEVGIDVLTVADANAIMTLDPATLDYAQLTTQKLTNVVAYNSAAGNHVMSPSMVMLTLGNADGLVDAGDLNITMASMTADCVIGSSLAGLQETMGSIYVSGVDITVDGLVAIGAH